MADNNPAISFDTAITQVRDMLNKAMSEAKPLTLKNVNYSGLPPSAVKRLTEAVAALAEIATPANASQVLELRKEIEKVTQSNIDLNSKLSEAQAIANQASRDYEKLKKHVDKETEGFDDYKSKTQAFIRQSKLDQLSFQNQIIALKKQLKEGEAKFNPDTATHLTEELEAASAGKISAEKRVVDLTVELETATREVEAQRREVASLRKSRDSAFSEANNIKDFKTLLQSRHPILDRKLASENNMLSLIFGEQANTWLVRLDNVTRTSIRDRAYHLMMAAKHSENHKLKVLSTLLTALFEWIKKQQRKVVLRLEGWLSELEADIKTASLKGLKYYREKLQQIKDGIEKGKAGLAKAQTKAKHSAKTFSSFVSSVAQTIKKAISPATVAAKATTVGVKIKSWIGKGFLKAGDAYVTWVGYAFYRKKTNNRAKRRCYASVWLHSKMPSAFWRQNVVDDMHAAGWSDWQSMLKDMSMDKDIIIQDQGAEILFDQAEAAEKEEFDEASG